MSWGGPNVINIKNVDDTRSLWHICTKKKNAMEIMVTGKTIFRTNKCILGKSFWGRNRVTITMTKVSLYSLF